MKRTSVDWEELARRLREVRGESTQVDFGKALGVLQNEVSRYEIGRVHPPLEYLVAVAKYGSVTLDWLILGQPPKHRKDGPRSGRV